MNELCCGGRITDGGPDYGSDVQAVLKRLLRVEKRLHIKGPKAPKKVPVSKVTFSMLPCCITGATKKDLAVILRRLSLGK